MSVAVVLFIILFVLMIAIGGKRGAKSFFMICANFLTLLIMLLLITIRLDPLKVTIWGCIFITSFTLFYLVGFNKKTFASFASVLLVVLFTVLIAWKAGADAKIHGFGTEQFESISYLSLYIQLDYAKVIICEILLGLLGAIIDVSISISSSMNEIYKNSVGITKKELFRSGLNIGKDILGAMTNTLLLAYVGSFMALLLWFADAGYTISEIINNKIFSGEVFHILCSGIGIILIIPVTASIASMLLPYQLPGRMQKVQKAG